MNHLLIVISVFLCCFGVFVLSRFARLDGRIIGGSPTNITKYPYQLSFETDGEHQCGASIISDFWAVTAAHCVEEVSKESVKLRAGSSYRGMGGSLYSVREIITHPDYDRDTVDYDVALIKVCNAFNFSTSVQPISLAISTPTAGTQSVVTGWGLTIEGNYTSLASQLQHVLVPVIEFNQCCEAYSEIDGITPRMICAGEPKGGKDACQNDSGGPLMSGGQLIGIVSWGRGCGDSEYPGVYTNVALVHAWISNVTNVH